jgi:hypothetical protein
VQLHYGLTRTIIIIMVGIQTILHMKF